MDWLPNYNQSNIVIALRAALAAAAILYVLEIYDIKNGMGHLGFLAVVLSCFAKPITSSTTRPMHSPVWKSTSR